MKSLLTILIFYAATACANTVYKCTVKSGVFKPLGVTTLGEALDRDPNLEGSVFMVEYPSGKVIGPAIFTNKNEKIEVLENRSGLFKVISKNEKNDISILRIKEFEGMYTFSFYFEFFELLLVRTRIVGL